MHTTVIRPADSRWGGYDLVRVLAGVGIVLLHASVPYLKHPMPGLA